MKIGLLGTRGIPNYYGGFEQLAEYLSVGLVKKGHEVFVYNPHNHPYKEEKWDNVNIIHCYDPEHKIGTPGQFIYDLNCINDARKRNFDILLHLGYTSDSIWRRRWPKKNTINMVNMDGLEWKREKYSRPVKRFLKWAESLAVKNAQGLIADSPEIQQYLSDTYDKEAIYIPYGATVFTDPDPDVLKHFSIFPGKFYLMIARIEPENNIEMIANGYLVCDQTYPLLIIGNNTNKYGKYLKEQYAKSGIQFPGAIYEKKVLDNLRYYSTIYFHGHSVGGTNPSLLEAMACQCNIASHKNIFNKYVLGNEAEYFSTDKEVAEIISRPMNRNVLLKRKEINLEKIETTYSWPKIITSYEEVMLSSLALVQ